MDFTLDEDEELVRDAARRLFSACPTSLVRATMDDPAAAAPLWEHLRQWTGLAGGPLVRLCLFLEEAGAALAPGPFLATSALCAPVLAAAGHSLLDEVLTGEATGTLAVAGRTGEWVPNEDREKTFVLEAGSVEWVAAVWPGPRLSLHRRPPAREIPTVDATRRFAAVELDPGEAELVPLAADALADALATATVAASAELVGTARRILEMALEHAKNRVQFDRPIGSFQAVQHKLADMALDVERARSAVFAAAMALDAKDPGRFAAAHAAQATAGAAATRNAKEGFQIHGGIGYTWEHDFHLYLRRVYASEPLLGTSSWHHERLFDELQRTGGAWPPSVTSSSTTPRTTSPTR
jgi:hypothetical protein